ncbi:MAG: hypothetical protein K0Q50_2670 [Vampirovibrio sp.]|jgi:hypothetical protein|nr:hypothetical protein [Vampirovibrio sp.]
MGFGVAYSEKDRLLLSTGSLAYFGDTSYLKRTGFGQADAPFPFKMVQFLP